MRMVKLGAIDLPTALLYLGSALCYAAWLTSIVFCATHDAWLLLLIAIALFPIGIVHGIGVWFGGW